MGTTIGCTLGLIFAAGLFRRELRLWRARGDLDGVLFLYTRRRFVRRCVGCAILALTMVMTFLALEVIDFTGHTTLFQVWWGIIAVLCLSLFVLPALDVRETVRHLARGGAEERMRAELERLTRERRSKESRDPHIPHDPRAGDADKR